MTILNKHLIIALLEGKTLQYKDPKNPHIWIDVEPTRGEIQFFLYNSTAENKDFEYRIKPNMIEEERWVNVYKDGDFGTLHKSKDAADIIALSRIAYVKVNISYYEGEGL